MPTTFRPYHPDQTLLLPPSLREWLPAGHLADHVSDLVDGLDVSAFYAPYEGDGRRKSPYEPAMMLKILIYGYATGVFSSRGLARRLEEDVAFRVLAAENFPSHRTICEFRRRHLADFKRLFAEVVRLAREMGVGNFGKLSIDGTKVRASASKRKAMSYGRMVEEERRLEAEIGARMAEKLATAAGRARYAQRKWLSEAPNGWIKEALGFRRFSLRGLDKARGEWDLVCLALNIRRLRGLQAA
ncbi:MAG: transposase [Gammaproteobacteria bacterium]|nr:transposase [Gammaproteobacteria bacterium]